MSRVGRWAFATLGSAVLLGVLAAASGPMWPHHADGHSWLRLSWGARPERIEVCRTLSEAELADRPEHMRQRVQCDGATASYQLLVRVDDSVLDARVLRGGGLRHDRPMHLLTDLQVKPGQRRVVVTLTRREADKEDENDSDDAVAISADTGIFAGRAEREREERKRQRRAAIPAALRLDTVVTFAPRQVQLITFDAESQQLRLESRGGGR